jgi:hypothetical protein
MIAMCPQYLKSVWISGRTNTKLNGISAHWHLGDPAPTDALCSLNTSNQRGVSYFLSSYIKVLPSRRQLRRRPFALVQQQAAPVSPTVDPETTVSRPKIKWPAVPPKMMAKTIKPLNGIRQTGFCSPSPALTCSTWPTT